MKSPARSLIVHSIWHRQSLSWCKIILSGPYALQTLSAVRLGMRVSIIGCVGRRPGLLPWLPTAWGHGSLLHCILISFPIGFTSLESLLCTNRCWFAGHSTNEAGNSHRINDTTTATGDGTYIELLSSTVYFRNYCSHISCIEPGSAFNHFTPNYNGRFWLVMRQCDSTQLGSWPMKRLRWL